MLVDVGFVVVQVLFSGPQARICEHDLKGPGDNLVLLLFAMITNSTRFTVNLLPGILPDFTTTN